MTTRYEMIYRQIKDKVDEIKESFEYPNRSISFGHLMLTYIFNISNDEANEAMTDGANDNGIDAIYHEKDESGNIIKTHFFQFKFPQSANNINRATTREEVLKLVEGYNHFTGNDSKFNELPWSELLKERREELRDLNTFKHDIWIVKFSTVEDSSNELAFKSKVDEIKTNTGNDINAVILKAGEITDYHEKRRLSEWPTFRLNYKKSLGIFSDDNSKIYHAYISIKNLYDALEPIQSIVLEGNVRYYDPRSNINEGIRTSLENDYERFHLLNNGITIVCHKVNDNTANDTLVIEKGSVINGAQTIGTIIRYIQSIDHADLDKYKRAFIYVKIIELTDINSLIEDIVFTLNTQNTMRLSYKISNNDIIKGIQEKINNETEYFLEIKKSEFYHMREVNADFNKMFRNIIDIEVFIQCFVAYYDIEGMGHITKTSRGALFTSERIEKIVTRADKDEMLKAYKIYLKIMKIIKQYRSYRKDNSKKQIFKTLNIGENKIDNYRYLNTGNFILLFAIGQYHELKNVRYQEKNIVPIIHKLSNFFGNKENISNETKKKDNFDKIKEEVKQWSFPQI